MIILISCLLYNSPYIRPALLSSGWDAAVASYWCTVSTGVPSREKVLPQVNPICFLCKTRIKYKMIIMKDLPACSLAGHQPNDVWWTALKHCILVKVCWEPLYEVVTSILMMDNNNYYIWSFKRSIHAHIILRWSWSEHIYIYTWRNGCIHWCWVFHLCVGRVKIST